jgi:uncharacterized protein (TIGR03437 family)
MATAVSFGIRADAQSPTVVRSASPPAAANGAAVSRLAYATFLRGNFGVLTIFGLTILPRAVADSAGNTFVADTLFSEFELPNTNNTQFTWDPFVMKISADGKSVVFTTDLKGQTVTGLALDPAGNIYVAGQGVSGTSAGFIAKLAPDGSVLYNTPITALPLAVAADAAGAAYVTGTATADFQTTPGAYKTGIGPAKCTQPNTAALVACSDAFVAKISADGASIIYATFLGGSANDSGQAIAVDQTGSAVVAGQTQSPDFPTTLGVSQPVYGGGSTNGFAARLDPTGRTLVYATFIGGSNADTATGVVLDSGQNAYLTGSTASSDFPVTPGAFQPAYGGAGDAFFLKLSPSGQAVFSSYLGGPTADSGGGIAMGAGNRFYVAIEDGAYRTQPANAFILQLDQRPPTPCDPEIAIMAVDATSGNVVDHYAVKAFGPSQTLSPGSLSVDGSGLVHIAGEALAPQGNSFVATPGAISIGGDADDSFLARVDFSVQEQFAQACMVNAASFDDEDVSVAPGEIFSLFGTGLGPAGGLVAQPDSKGTYPRQLGGTSILIGNTAIPLLYVSDSQVNAVVPYSLSTGPTSPGTNLTIQNGSFSASYTVKNILPAWPGIFTQASGQAAALNQDGSINSPSNPAAVGSVVSFFATGLGPLNPALPDDAMTPLSAPWPGLADSFGAYMQAATPSGSSGMEVLYAGPAPGMPPGGYQVNARVSAAAVSGQAQVQFMMGTCPPCTASSSGPYVWVQGH